MKWVYDELSVGDMIRVNMGGFYHFGIFVSYDEIIQFGLPPTSVSKIKNEDVQVLSSTIEVFGDGKPVEKAVYDKRELKKKFPVDKIVSTARNSLGEKGYDIFHNNCEHFAYFCVFGERRSLSEERVIKLFKQNKLSVK